MYPSYQCPRCGISGWMLSTMDEWDGYCAYCDIRFNKDGDILGAARKAV